MRKRRKKVELATMVVGLVGSGLLVLGLLYGLYGLFFQTLNRLTLAWWGMIAVLLIPLAGAIGFALGNYKATSFLAGLEKGTDTVIDKADKVGAVKVAQVARVRGQTTAQVDYNQFLPEPKVVHRQLEDSGEMIDL